jgi:hypothetical protein
MANPQQLGEPARHRWRPLLVGLALAGALLIPAAAPAAAAARTTRSFSCSGNLGADATASVSGSLTLANVPFNVTVQQPIGTVAATHTGAATAIGPSWLHAGYTEWDVTDPANPNGDLHYLNLPPVLPGAGGYFDADLEIQFAGGAWGGLQIPMFDCTITGGPARLAMPGPRTFACSGSMGDRFSLYTVAGWLSARNVPSRVTTTQVATGTAVYRSRTAASLGASVLHPGWVQWDITARNVNGDLFYLNVPGVLPAAGDYFDAYLEVSLAGGANGGLQIPMFDCTTK